MKKGIALVTVVAIVAVGWLWVAPMLNIDKCLDGGGRWDYQTKSCQFATGNRK